MSHARLLPILLVGLIVSSVTAAWGAVVVVNPVRIHLSASKRSELLQLKNNGQEAARFQVVAHSWQESPDGKMKLLPTRDLIFFPSLLEIKPGETRRLRVASTIAPGRAERSYRLVVEQLPGIARQGEVQVLTHLSIPVFVQPAAPKPTPTVNAAVRRDRLLVRVGNTGNAYFKTQSVRVVARSRTGAVVFDQTLSGWYVLARAHRFYAVDLPQGACAEIASVSTTATTERGKTSAVTAIEPGTACGS